MRLASRLCGWEIEIKTRAEFEAEAMGLPPPTRDPENSAGGESAPEDERGSPEEGSPRASAAS